MITYNGFYDLNLEWVGLDGVQIVASMNSTSSVGRHQLSSRFTSIVRICSIGYKNIYENLFFLSVVCDMFMFFMEY